MSTHSPSGFTKDNKVQPLQSSSQFKYSQNALLLPWGNLWLDMVSAVQLNKRLHLSSHFTQALSSGWAFSRFMKWNTEDFERCKWETTSVITSRNKGLQEYPKCGPLTMHHHGLNGNASQHQATVHALTYGGSSTTNFHHLLQFHWEWEGPRQRVMDRSFGAPTQLRTLLINCLIDMHSVPSQTFSQL